MQTDSKRDLASSWTHLRSDVFAGCANLEIRATGERRHFDAGTWQVSLNDDLGRGDTTLVWHLDAPSGSCSQPEKQEYPLHQSDAEVAKPDEVKKCWMVFPRKAEVRRAEKQCE